MVTFWKVTKLKYKQSNNLQDHPAHAAEKTGLKELKRNLPSFLLTNKISNPES